MPDPPFPREGKEGEIHPLIQKTLKKLLRLGLTAAGLPTHPACRQALPTDQNLSDQPARLQADLPAGQKTGHRSGLVVWPARRAVVLVNQPAGWLGHQVGQPTDRPGRLGRQAGRPADRPG